MAKWLYQVLAYVTQVFLRPTVTEGMRTSDTEGGLLCLSMMLNILPELSNLFFT